MELWLAVGTRSLPWYDVTAAADVTAWAATRQAEAAAAMPGMAVALQAEGAAVIGRMAGVVAGVISTGVAPSLT
jgi:hypothetical protein